MASYTTYRIGQRLALTLPLGLSYWIAERLGELRYLMGRADRKALEHNMTSAIRHTSQRSQYVRETFRNFGKYLIDLLRTPCLTQDSIQRQVQVDGWEHLEAVYAEYGCAISVTAHVGNWEAAGAVTAQLGRPVAAIALDHDDPRVTAFFKRQRQITGVTTIPIGGALRASQQRLREGYVVAILGDYDYTAHGADCTFLGQQIQAPRGPALLSLRSGVPIVPGFFFRGGPRTFRLVFEPAIVPQSTGDRERDVRAVSQRILAVIERYVRQYPTQWFLFRPFDVPGMLRL